MVLNKYLIPYEICILALGATALWRSCHVLLTAPHTRAIFQSLLLSRSGVQCCSSPGSPCCSPLPGLPACTPKHSPSPRCGSPVRKTRCHTWYTNVFLWGLHLSHDVLTRKYEAGTWTSSLLKENCPWLSWPMVKPGLGWDGRAGTVCFALLSMGGSQSAVKSGESEERNLASAGQGHHVLFFSKGL